MNKKLLILSQYYSPDIASTGQVLTQLAEDLSKRGIEVKVITGKTTSSNVPSYEVLNGVKVWRVNLLRLNKSSTLGRLLSFFSFFLSVLIKLPFIGKFDSVLIVSNPPMLPIIGHYLKKMKKVKFTFLLHDLYPDVALKMGVTTENSIMTKAMNWINRKVFASADHIVVLGRDAKQLLIEKGVKAEKIKIITNWAEDSSVSSEEIHNIKEKLLSKNKFSILYTGNIGLFYDLEYIVEAMLRVKDLPIEMIFVGEGVKKPLLMELVKRYNLTNVRFLPYQPKEDYNSLLQAADVLLVALAKGMEGISVPSKTYGYLASGRPILAVLPAKSEIGQIVKEGNCGIQVEPRDLQGIEAAIKKLYENDELRKMLGQNARDLFEKEYCRQKVTRKFIDVI
ncbi:glycosyltransferase family 4 protein [Anoxybacillus ayderensis]|uniref:glycosyltransferase family 4 protein n=1 Tax=Anoxybacillus ayderensis TaxID=265546 RepID=UPI002E1D398C|nr:glycosyltransferase family 4 protein [Anoxybacillus ayderensis]